VQKYQAILFDLDDTLVDRNKALEKLFSIILEKCYLEIKPAVKNEMFRQFKQLDNKGLTSDKNMVLEPLFDTYPPVKRIAKETANDFWAKVFPTCFSTNSETIDTITKLKQDYKMAIITNGKTLTQKAKIKNANLAEYFDAIFISEEAGYSKPDKEIFELALATLNVNAKEAIFVGDNVLSDIRGCQNAGIKGIWINPDKIENNTGIKPYREIIKLQELFNILDNN